MSLLNLRNKLNMRQTLNRFLAMVAVGAILIAAFEIQRCPETAIKKKEKDKDLIFLDEKKYADYSFCNKIENSSKWEELFLKPKVVDSEENFIPLKLEEAPVGLAPSIPKEFLIEENDFCLKRPKLKAIAVVHTAIKNVDRRSVTRQTWGNASEELGVVFVIGRTSNKEEEDIVSKESQLHHDIIQGNFSDHYKLLTYKHLNALYWLTKNCKHVQWVVKADDDILLDVKKYLYFIDNLNNARNASDKIFCDMLCNNPVIRDKDRFAVSKKEFSYNHYPTYCLGCLYFTSISVVQALLDVVPQVKYLWIDDILVTGIMAVKANIQRYRIKIPGGSLSTEDVGKFMAWQQLYSERLKLWRNFEKYYNPQYPSALADDLSSG